MQLSTLTTLRGSMTQLLRTISYPACVDSLLIVSFQDLVWETESRMYE